MKLKRVIFIGVLLYLSGCAEHGSRGLLFKVSSVETSYIKKGPLDSFDISEQTSYLDSGVVLLDSLILLPRIDDHFRPMACGDTLSLGNKYFLKVRDDDWLSRRYPGDELYYLNDAVIPDSLRYVSRSFASLLRLKNDKVAVFQLLDKEKKITTCKLFVMETAEHYVLFSDNEFVLFILDRHD